MSSTRAENPLGFLDASAFGSAHVQAELTGIDVGKKSVPTTSDQAQRRQHEHAIDQRDARPVMQAPAQYRAVFCAHFFELTY